MDGACGIWHGFGALWRWLFVEECSNATSLLSLSFAVNFSNLPLARLNLCAWTRRKVHGWVRDTLDDTFVNEIERLGKGNEKVAAKLVSHSCIMEKFDKAMEKGPAAWEKALRLVTACFAIMIFLFMAIGVKTRIGVALACPYLVFLICHTIWTMFLAVKVLISRHDLLKAKDEAERNRQVMVDMAVYADKLRAVRKALSPDGKPKKARTPRKAAKT